MSPLSEIHIEFPYIYNMEATISDLSVFNSQGTLEAQRSWYPESYNRLAIYPNPAPLEFSKHPTEYNSTLSSILVVSNHRPPELDDAIALLQKQGIHVDQLQDVRGQRAGTITSAEVLSKYDCVISIGKTVQYCLAMGKPVFIYDRFGGPGFLNETNFDSVAHYTFSGRIGKVNNSLVQSLQQTQNHLSAQDIVKQLTQEYTNAVQFYKHNRVKFINNYSIDKVFPILLNIAKQNQTNNKLSEHYQKYLIHTQFMTADYVVSNQHLANPISEFYRQKVQLFYSTDGTFNEQNSSFFAPLQDKVSLK